jgi:hypothetical protein
MASAEVVVPCDKCGSEFHSIPKTSFLGFRQLTCPQCGHVLTLPMARRYRLGFWVIALLFGIGFVVRLLDQGVFSLPTLIPILAGIALYRNWQLRKKVSIATEERR